METTTAVEVPEQQLPEGVVFDLADLDTKTPSEQGRDLYLRNPKTGALMFCPDGSPATIGFVGPDSDSVKKVQRRNRDEQMETLNANGKPVDPDAKEKRDRDDMASFARRWNLPPIDGKAVPFSLGAAKTLFHDPRFTWMPEQAVLFVHTRERFFAEPSAN